MERSLRTESAVPRRGGDFDRWDIELRGGVLGGARLLTTIEEHGAGRQYLRVRAWPRVSGAVAGLASLFAGLAAGAAFDHDWAVAAVLATAVLGVGLRVGRECGAALSVMMAAVERLRTAGVASDHQPTEHPAYDLTLVDAPKAPVEV